VVLIPGFCRHHLAIVLEVTGPSLPIKEQNRKFSLGLTQKEWSSVHKPLKSPQDINTNQSETLGKRNQFDGEMGVIALTGELP